MWNHREKGPHYGTAGDARSRRSTTHTSTGARGTQVVGRVAALLRLVSQSGSAGMRLNDLVSRTGLTKPTAHRLLKSLATEGMLDRDEATGRWYLGPELYVMGSASASRFRSKSSRIHRSGGSRKPPASPRSCRCGAAMKRCACCARRAASRSDRSRVLVEGKRFPARHRIRRPGDPCPPEPGRARGDLARLDLDGRMGQGPVDLGHPFHDRGRAHRRLGRQSREDRRGQLGNGRGNIRPCESPMWALTLTGIEARFRPERQAELGRQLLFEAHRVSKAVSTVPLSSARRLTPGRVRAAAMRRRIRVRGRLRRGCRAQRARASWMRCTMNRPDSRSERASPFRRVDRRSGRAGRTRRPPASASRLVISSV